jgi:flagellar biosynthesis protein FlhF
MKIKSYYCRTVEDAVASARHELGPEAMLLETRRVLPELRHLGEYEVVFASLAPEPSVEDASSQSPSGIPAASLPGDRLSVEVSDLKRELESMRRAITRTAYAPPQWAEVPQDVSDAYAILTAAEVAPDMAREIVQAAGVRLSNHRVPQLQTSKTKDGGAFLRALVDEMEGRFTADPVLGRGSASPRIVALAGPPGSGKTTTLVKLAVNYGLAARRGVLLLTIDTRRVAAADQLRSYAAILGVGFQVLETVGALAQTIEENRGKELILIDTPGLTPAELADETSLARFLAARSDIDIHLVLPASMKPADLSRVVDSFGALDPKHLLFTRLDETGSFGPIFTECARTGKPLSFFATGQRIPEDMEVASQERLLDLILAGHGKRARSAA